MERCSLIIAVMLGVRRSASTGALSVGREGSSAPRQRPARANSGQNRDAEESINCGEDRREPDLESTAEKGGVGWACQIQPGRS